MEASEMGGSGVAERPPGPDEDRAQRDPKKTSRRPAGAPAAPRRRLRPRGSGGVLPVRDGVWRVDVEAPRDPETGRRRRTSRFVDGTREEAELALAQLRVAAHQRRLPTGKARPRSARAVLEAYVREAESGRIELAPSTVVTTRSASKTMAETRLSDGTMFGDLRLSALTWERVEDLYASMRASGRGSDWVRRCATVLSRALEQARKRGVIETNPCRDATRPKSIRSKPFAPSAPEVRKLIEAVSAADPEIGDAALILASTGMRRGELLGLFWDDIDVPNGEVHVAAALTDGGRGVGLVRKATKRSEWRDVPLTPGAVAAIERQAARRAFVTGEAPVRNEYVLAGGIAHEAGGSQPSVERRPRQHGREPSAPPPLRGYGHARRWRVVSNGCRHPRQFRIDAPASLRRSNGRRQAARDHGTRVRWPKVRVSAWAQHHDRLARASRGFNRHRGTHRRLTTVRARARARAARCRA